VSLPTPQPGLVIRYSYLWSAEAQAGKEEGTKDRPCAIILVLAGEQGRQRVRVLPVSHSPPHDPEDGLEIPAVTKARLGLDGERSWIVISEANDFVWPGPDLRPLPGKGLESVAYGFLPPRFFRVLRDRIALRYRARRLSAVTRSE
jgi:hypothetical protein